MSGLTGISEDPKFPGFKAPESLTLPVIGAPMFLVSSLDLVTAQCKAGIIGTFPALNARSSSELAEWIDTLEERLAPDEQAAVYGINMVVNSKANARLEADFKVCVSRKVPFVITGLGLIPDLIAAIHGYGGIVYHVVSTRHHAEKALAAGVDGLILVCAGAGGHEGTLNPFAFMSEMRSVYDGPLALSGCISTGAAIASVRVLGADFAYMGSRFIATKEAGVADAYKKMILSSRADDIMPTSYFSGVRANFLTPSLLENGFNLQDLKAVVSTGIKTMDGQAKAWRDIWSAGQGIGCIEDCPTVAELVTALKAEYHRTLRRFS